MTSGFADDTQLIARDAQALVVLLDKVERFCLISGFKLNRHKTEILTYTVMPPALAPLVVNKTTLTKALGLLVAPDLPNAARFDRVFKNFVDRLQLWSHRAQSLAGKVVVLQAVCLSILWYQLAFVAPTTKQADCID